MNKKLTTRLPLLAIAVLIVVLLAFAAMATLPLSPTAAEATDRQASSGMNSFTYQTAREIDVLQGTGSLGDCDTVYLQVKRGGVAYNFNNAPTYRFQATANVAAMLSWQVYTAWDCNYEAASIIKDRIKTGFFRRTSNITFDDEELEYLPTDIGGSYGLVFYTGTPGNNDWSDPDYFDAMAVVWFDLYVPVGPCEIYADIPKYTFTYHSWSSCSLTEIFFNKSYYSGSTIAWLDTSYGDVLTVQLIGPGDEVIDEYDGTSHTAGYDEYPAVGEYYFHLEWIECADPVLEAGYKNIYFHISERIITKDYDGLLSQTWGSVMMEEPDALMGLGGYGVGIVWYYMDSNDEWQYLTPTAPAIGANNIYAELTGPDAILDNLILDITVSGESVTKESPATLTVAKANVSYTWYDGSLPYSITYSVETEFEEYGALAVPSSVVSAIPYGADCSFGWFYNDGEEKQFTAMTDAFMGVGYAIYPKLYGDDADKFNCDFRYSTMGEENPFTDGYVYVQVYQKPVSIDYYFENTYLLPNKFYPMDYEEDADAEDTDLYWTPEGFTITVVSDGDFVITGWSNDFDVENHKPGDLIDLKEHPLGTETGVFYPIIASETGNYSLDGASCIQVYIKERIFQIDKGMATAYYDGGEVRPDWNYSFKNLGSGVYTINPGESFTFDKWEIFSEFSSLMAYNLVSAVGDTGTYAVELTKDWDPFCLVYKSGVGNTFYDAWEYTVVPGRPTIELVKTSDWQYREVINDFTSKFTFTITTNEIAEDQIDLDSVVYEWWDGKMGTWVNFEDRYPAGDNFPTAGKGSLNVCVKTPATDNGNYAAYTSEIFGIDIAKANVYMRTNVSPVYDSNPKTPGGVYDFYIYQPDDEDYLYRTQAPNLQIFFMTADPTAQSGVVYYYYDEGEYKVKSIEVGDTIEPGSLYETYWLDLVVFGPGHYEVSATDAGTYKLDGMINSANDMNGYNLFDNYQLVIDEDATFTIRKASTISGDIDDTESTYGDTPEFIIPHLAEELSGAIKEGEDANTIWETFDFYYSDEDGLPLNSDKWIDASKTPFDQFFDAGTYYLMYKYHYANYTDAIVRSRHVVNKRTVSLTWYESEAAYNAYLEAFAADPSCENPGVYNPEDLTVQCGDYTYNGAAQQPFVVFGNVVNGDPVDPTYYYTYKSGESWLYAEGYDLTRAASHRKIVNLLGNGNYKMPNDGLGAGVCYVIKKAELTVTADDKVVTYGDAAPSYTYSITGFVGGETEADLREAGKLSGSATRTCAYYAFMAAVNTPVIYCAKNDGDTLTAENYTFTYVNGTLTINKADYDGYGVSQNGSIVYNGNAQSPAAKVAISYGTLENDPNYVVTVTYKKHDDADEPGNWTVAMPSWTNAGTYYIDYKFENANYNTVTGTFSFTISPADFEGYLEHYSGETLTYNGELQTPVVDYSDLHSVTGAYVVRFKAANGEGDYEYLDVPQFKDAGTHIVFYRATAANHNPLEGSFTVVINKKTVTVTFDKADLIKTYDGEVFKPDGIGVISGVVEGESLATVFDNVGRSNSGSYFAYFTLSAGVGTTRANYTLASVGEPYGNAVNGEYSVFNEQGGLNIRIDPRVIDYTMQIGTASDSGYVNANAVVYDGETKYFRVVFNNNVDGENASILLTGDKGIEGTAYKFGTEKDDYPYYVVKSGSKADNYVFANGSDEMVTFSISSKIITVTYNASAYGDKDYVYGDVAGHLDTLNGVDDDFLNWIYISEALDGGLTKKDVFDVAFRKDGTGDPISLTAKTDVGRYYFYLTTKAGVENYAFNYVVNSDENAYIDIGYKSIYLSWGFRTAYTVACNNTGTAVYYDGREHTYDATITGLLPGDEVDLIYNGANAVTNKNAGTYNVGYRNGVYGNYYLSSGSSSYTIQRRPILIQLGEDSTTYGTYKAFNDYGITTAAYAYDGRDPVIGDDNKEGSVFSFTHSLTATADVGAYQLHCYGDTTGNYTVEYRRLWYEGGEPRTEIYIDQKIFTVNPLPVTLSWSADSFTYDKTPHSVTATVTNAVFGDSVRVEAYGGDDDVINANIGNATYSLTATALSNSNYTLVGCANATHYWTITPRHITIVAGAKESYYGEDPVLLTAVSSVLEGDSVYTLSCEVNNKSNAGNYTININLIENSNYVVDSKTTAVYRVKQRPVRFKIGDNSKVHTSYYGDDLATLTAEWVEDVEGGCMTILEGDEPKFTLRAYENILESVELSAISPVGDYPITGSDDDPNYAISFYQGRYWIAARPVEVLLAAAGRVYGSTASYVNYGISTTATGNPVVGKDNADGSVYTMTHNLADDAAVGEYSISVSSTNTNYEVSFVYYDGQKVEPYDGQKIYTVTNATLTNVNVEQDGKAVYNGNTRSIAIVKSATAVNDMPVTFSYKISKNAEEYSYAELPYYKNAGTYTVYYKASADNHDDAFGSFDIVIDKADALVVELTVSDTTYGTAFTVPTLASGITVTGWLGNEGDSTATVLTANNVSVSYGNVGATESYLELNEGDWTSEAPTHVGNYYVRVVIKNVHNYENASGAAKFTIAKKKLIVKAQNADVAYGDNIPTYQVQSIEGFVYDEREDNLAGTLAYRCDYTKTSAVDTYAIEPYGYTSTDYDIVYEAGRLTVYAATLTDVVVEQTGKLVYNGTAQTATLDASAVAINDQIVTFTYSATEDGEYAATVPAFTNAGSNKVFYKVNAAYHAEATGFVEVVIGKAEPVIDVTAVVTEKRYTGDEISFEGGATVSCDEGALAYENAVFTKVGEYEMTVVFAETANYQAARVAVAVKVLEAEVVPIVDESGEEVVASYKDIEEDEAGSVEGVSIIDAINNVIQAAAEAPVAKLELNVGETTTIVFDKAALTKLAENADVKFSYNETRKEDIADEAMKESVEMIVSVSLSGATFDGGKATVTVAFVNNAPEGKQPAVYYVDLDGKFAENMNAVFKDGLAIFDTTHFSDFAIVYEDVPTQPVDPTNPTDPTDPTDPTQPEENGGNEEVAPEKGGLSTGALVGIIVGAVALVAVVIVVVLVLKKKKTGGETKKPEAQKQEKDDKKGDKA